MKKYWLEIVLIIAILVGMGVCLCRAEESKPPVNMYKGLIGEAVGEGYNGMLAVACVYRNRLRRGLTLGCVALKRKDLDEFVNRQPKRYIRMAKKIVRLVFEEDCPDITNGATHYENIELYGIPWWAVDMKETTIIGRHTFMIER